MADAYVTPPLGVYQSATLQQRGHQVDPRQERGSFFAHSSDLGHLVIESLQSRIALPAVGLHRTAGLDTILDKRVEASGGSILDDPHANATNALSIRLRRDHN